MHIGPKTKIKYEDEILFILVTKSKFNNYYRKREEEHSLAPDCQVIGIMLKTAKYLTRNWTFLLSF